MKGLLTPPELEALRLSLEVAGRSVLLSLPLAILIAWVLARARVPGRTLFDAFVHLPLVLPPVAVGYMLLLLFGTRGRGRTSRSRSRRSARTPRGSGS